MSNNRDDEPAYIFCNAETKEELAKRSGENMPPDEVFVVADVVLPGTCIVVTKEELRQWLFAKGNDHDVWTIPEEDLHDPNKTV